MTSQLRLLAHAATVGMRTAVFPGDDETLDPRAAAELAGWCGKLAYSDRQWVSPASPARQTAAVLGLSAQVEPALAECDFGRWRGQSLQSVQAREPHTAAQWMLDPAKAPHGGESFESVIGRVRRWMEDQSSARGITLAITHASVVRAAVIVAIEAEPSSFRRIDIAPGTLLRLSGHAGRWNLVGLGGLENAA